MMMLVKEFIERTNALELLGVPENAFDVLIHLPGRDRFVEVTVKYHPEDKATTS